MAGYQFVPLPPAARFPQDGPSFPSPRWGRFFGFWRIAIVIDEAVALRAHQTQEFGGVDLANIAEMLCYSDDPIPML